MRAVSDPHPIPRRAIIASDFAADLEDRIVKEYVARGDQLGWRLLYSPLSVLEHAEVAFIGLNPGGAHAELDHPAFACPDNSSAYLHERWKDRPPGQEKLQKQVQRLFDHLGVTGPSVLAGNLVPFRSRTWGELRDKKRALEFGFELWQEILDRARPTLVIAMGRETSSQIRSLLRVTDLFNVPIEWSTVTAARGRFRAGRFVGLPHLSRYQMFGRRASETAIQILFDDWFDSRS